MACFGSPISTIVAWPVNARSRTSHCTGSVSWNSSTSTIFQRCRIRARAGASGCSSASASWLSRSSYDRIPSRRLRLSISSRTALAKQTRRPAGVSLLSAVGSSRACGSLTAVRAMASASAQVNTGATVGVREGAEVEVVDDLAQQVVEVLDQPGPAVGVAGDPERTEHHRAELVGGGDGRGVEVGQRVGDPAVPERPFAGVAVEEQLDQVGLLDRGQRGVSGQRALGLDQLGPDPFAELLAGRPAERHDQHLLERADALGDEAGDQRADGPGLAGAGAGLEQGGAGRQRVADVEGVGRHSAATLSPPVSSGSQIRQAYVGRPASTSADSGAPSPQTRDVDGVGVLALDAPAVVGVGLPLALGCLRGRPVVADQLQGVGLGPGVRRCSAAAAAARAARGRGARPAPGAGRRRGGRAARRAPAWDRRGRGRRRGRSSSRRGAMR